MARKTIQEGAYYAADFFRHDSDMRNDIKVKALRKKFKHKGYAVWCFLLETFTDSDNFEIEYGEIERELLASDFDVPVEELTEITDYCIKIGLLQTEGGKLFSETHKRRFKEVFDQSARRREANRQNGLKGGNPNFKKGQPNPYYQQSADTPKDNPMGNVRLSQDNPKITEDITQDNPTIQDKTIRDNTKKKTPKGDKRKFTPPTVDEVRAYAQSKGYSIDPERFCDYYISNGWKVGRNPMKDWQATVRQWAARDREQHPTSTPQAKGSLGVGEFRDPQGRRTYGTSGQIVPEDAAPRPSAGHWWSDASRQWERMQ